MIILEILDTGGQRSMITYVNEVTGFSSEDVELYSTVGSSFIALVAAGL